jgi:hypothetical protein
MVRDHNFLYSLLLYTIFGILIRLLISTKFETTVPALHMALNNTQSSVSITQLYANSYSSKHGILCLKIDQIKTIKFLRTNSEIEPAEYLNKPFQMIPFNDFELKYDFNSDCKYFYMFEYQTEFSMFRLENGQCLCKLPFHVCVRDFLMTENYFCVSTENGSIVTYMIIDKNDDKKISPKFDELLQIR